MARIVSPARISFVGGGTDIESFYSQEGGAVIALAISARIDIQLELNSNSQLVEIIGDFPEVTSEVGALRNPIMRECLRYFSIDSGVRIEVKSSIPAGSGLASSSSLACGLVSGLALLAADTELSKLEIAETASFIETKKAGRPIGKQDHFACAYGGLNIFRFMPSGEVHAQSIGSDAIVEKLATHLLVLDTGIRRDAGHVLQKLNASIGSASQRQVELLRKLRDLVDPFAIAVSSGLFAEAGQVLQEAWLLKRAMGPGSSVGVADFAIESAIKMGAFGGKLLGAGSGGCILIFADPTIHDRIVDHVGLKKLPIPTCASGVKVELV